MSLSVGFNALGIVRRTDSRQYSQIGYHQDSPTVCSQGKLKSGIRTGGGLLPISERFQKKFIRASYDEEFRSSRSIAIGLHRRYKAVLNGGHSKNLKEFISAGVTAYAVGCTDEGIRKELLSVGDLNEPSEESGSVGLKCKPSLEEVEECILWVSLVFLTILCSPPPAVIRWSTTSAVSAEAQIQWRGFCALIANAYYLRGMAWLPVKTLQMEQMLVGGYAEEPSLVADRMRIVFGTLEIICPQWPKL